MNTGNVGLLKVYFFLSVTIFVKLNSCSRCRSLSVSRGIKFSACFAKRSANSRVRIIASLKERKMFRGLYYNHESFGIKQGGLGGGAWEFGDTCFQVLLVIKQTGIVDKIR